MNPIQDCRQEWRACTVITWKDCGTLDRATRRYVWYSPLPSACPRERHKRHGVDHHPPSLITSSHSRDRTATNSRGRNRIPTRSTHPHIHKISHTQQQHKKKGGFCWWQYDSSTECVVVGRSFVSLLVPTLRRKKETNERGIVGKAGKSSRLSCRLYHLIRPIGRIPRWVFVVCVCSCVVWAFPFFGKFNNTLGSFRCKINFFRLGCATPTH